jgi:hypothetical protein
MIHTPQFGLQSTAAFFESLTGPQGPGPFQGLPVQQTPQFQQMVAQGMDPATPVHLLGWVNDFPARVGLAATFARPLAQTAPHLMAAKAEDNVFLYKAWKEALGAYLAYIAQAIGDCTSFGSSHAVDLLQCVEIVIGKLPLTFHEICTEAIYGAGREIAGMLGGGDGCYGVAVAKAFLTVGSTTRKAVGPYSGQRAKSWGRNGVPADVKTSMAPFKVKATALITTLDELDASLSNGYPSAGGYSEGFTMTRDANGMCRRSGRWGHETCFVGKRTRNGQREYLMCQSWGPNVPSGPCVDDQPDYSWWMTADEAANILGQQDWLTFSGGPQFEVRPLPSTWTYSQYI